MSIQLLENYDDLGNRQLKQKNLLLVNALSCLIAAAIDPYLILAKSDPNLV